MDIPWQLCRTIGPLLSQRFPLASAKAQPREGFPIVLRGNVLCSLKCMVYCIVIGSVHSSYTPQNAVDLQCTLHYTAGTLRFSLGSMPVQISNLLPAHVDCIHLSFGRLCVNPKLATNPGSANKISASLNSILSVSLSKLSPVYKIKHKRS